MSISRLNGVATPDIAAVNLRASSGIATVNGEQYGTLWTPADLPTPPTIWLNDDSAVTDAGAGACSQWNDISGGNHHFVQTTGANRPLIVGSGLGGRRTIRFDGSSDMLYCFTSALSLYVSQAAMAEFVVYKKIATDAGVSRIVTFIPSGGVGAAQSGYTIACSGTGGGEANKTRGIARRVRADAVAALTQVTSLGTAWQMAAFRVVFADRDGFLDINGANDQTSLTFTSAGATSEATSSSSCYCVGGSPSATGNNPGTSNAADVEIAERILVRSSLSQDDIDRMFGYLAWRWGLVGDLPPGHPYKLAPPYQ
jgi:hypothetical protein